MSIQKTTAERMIEAEERCSKWLADGNAAEERGDDMKAEKCFNRSQFWRDRYNWLAGND